MSLSKTTMVLLALAAFGLLVSFGITGYIVLCYVKAILVRRRQLANEEAASAGSTDGVLDGRTGTGRGGEQGDGPGEGTASVASTTTSPFPDFVSDHWDAEDGGATLVSDNDADDEADDNESGGASIQDDPILEEDYPVVHAPSPLSRVAGAHNLSHSL
jgi:hypothetical protein